MGHLVAGVSVRALLCAWPLVVWMAASACGADDSEPAARRDQGVPPDTFVPTVTVRNEPNHPNVGDRVRLSVQVTGYSVKEYRWAVQDPEDQPVEIVPPSGPSASAEFAAAGIGAYTVRCQALLAGGQLVSGQVSVTATDPTVPRRWYRVRIVPPPRFEEAVKDQILSMAGADLREQTITLEQAMTRPVEVTWKGSAVDTQLRLFTLEGEDLAPRDVLLPSGKGQVQLPLAFRALFVPLLPVAPSLVQRVGSVTSLKATWTVNADEGIKVGGKVLSAAGAALAGVRVSLAVPAEGLLAPSTVGVTDAAGSFSVSTRSGEAALVTVAPPIETGLPVAVAAVSVPAAGGSGWSFTYDAIKTSTFSAKLSRSDGGGPPAAGALVVLSRSDAAPVGTLVVSGKAVTATGRYRYAFTSDASGNLCEVSTGQTELSLPVGSYRLEAWPGKGERSDQGYSSSTEVLLAGRRAAPLTAALVKRVTLKGSVSSELTAAQVQVTARAGADRSFIGAVDATGKYSLVVDDKSVYAVTARALNPGKRLATTTLAPQVAVDGDQTLAEARLPKAVLCSGWVKTGGNAIVPGASVRVWCVDPSCPDQQLVDETQSQADGSFVVRIPVVSEKK